MTLSAAQLAHNRAIAKKGGLARAKTLTSEHQAAAGRAGSAATARIKGAHWIAEQAASWRRENLSPLALAVKAWLDEWNEVYAVDAPVGRYFADFKLPHNIIIEADGDPWHENNDIHGEDREAWDRQRDAAFETWGYHIIRLAQADIESGAAKDQLRRQLDQIQSIPF